MKAKVSLKQYQEILEKRFKEYRNNLWVIGYQSENYDDRDVLEITDFSVDNIQVNVLLEQKETYDKNFNYSVAEGPLLIRFIISDSRDQNFKFDNVLFTAKDLRALEYVNDDGNIHITYEAKDYQNFFNNVLFIDEELSIAMQDVSEDDEYEND